METRSYPQGCCDEETASCPRARKGRRPAVDHIESLFKNNRNWSLRIRKKDPAYFRKLVRVQKPAYLWIGCSDSRVPANEITGLLPGELFVHRNIANIVYLDDLNCTSVVCYAVDVLKVKHIIVCGHYNCGGVKAVVESRRLGRVSLWLRDIKRVMRENGEALKKMKTEREKIDFLCEMNVLRQARNVMQLEPVARAMKGNRHLRVHAWIYDLNDGLVKELFSSGRLAGSMQR